MLHLILLKRQAPHELFGLHLHIQQLFCHSLIDLFYGCMRKLPIGRLFEYMHLNLDQPTDISENSDRICVKSVGKLFDCLAMSFDLEVLHLL